MNPAMTDYAIRTHDAEWFRRQAEAAGLLALNCIRFIGVPSHRAEAMIPRMADNAAKWARLAVQFAEIALQKESR